MAKKAQDKQNPVVQGMPSIQCGGGYHFLCRDPSCVCRGCGHGTAAK